MLGPLSLLILQALVIIVAARVVGALARRLGQPSVIAEVIAGVLLGPSLLGRLAPGLSATLFARASLPALSLLSQVGLVFFMFLIGLELDPKLLRGRGAVSLAISAAGILVPFVLGAAFALRIYDHQAALAVPKASFTLFMGIAMSITAFPVLARILAERKLIRTQLGSLVLACAAADDVTAWCLLAFVVSFVHAKGSWSVIATVAEAAGFAGFMWLGVRPLLARLGARITTRENLTQNVVALTFVLLLASAFTTEMIGIHALFGAFLFGTIMPRQGDYAQALAERLEDFVVVALLPLFFAYSGLRTELGLVVGARDWLTCLTLIVVACAGKFGGTFGVARLFGMSLRDSAAIGVLMNTRGLMELIVLNVGLDLGVISPKIFTMMVLMALVTTIMTTPLLKLVAPRALLARASDRSASESHARFLFCVGDARSGPAMAQLAMSVLCRAEQASAPGDRLELSLALHLERPRDRTSNYLGSALLEERAVSRAGLASFVDALATGALPVEALCFDSRDPAFDICEVARAKDCDYVVLGLHRPVLGQNVFGGIVGTVLAESPAPVLLLIDHGLVRAFTRPAAPRRVLMGLCGGAEDVRVLDFATQLLRDRKVTLSLLQIAASDGDQSGPFARALELSKLHSERVQVRVERATAGLPIVLSAALEADLLVLGVELHWGLSSEGLESDAARRLLDCAASLLLIQGSHSRPDYG